MSTPAIRYYDEIREFRHIPDCAEKVELAVSRMENPYSISDEDRAEYQDYLQKKGPLSVPEFIDNNKITKLPFLVKYRVIRKANVQKFTDYAHSARKMDSLSYLLNVGNDFRNHPKELDIAKKFTIGKSKNEDLQKLPDYETVKVNDVLWLGVNPMPWVVLEKKNGKILVISKFAFDCEGYNRVFEHATWDTCSMRRWLNGDFMESTFSQDERDMMETIHIGKDDVLYFDEGEDRTNDKLFLLSDKEADKYFRTNEEKLARVTFYAKRKNLWQTFDYYAHWWLRTESHDEIGGTYVSSSGDISYCGGIIISNGFDRYYDHFGVRPAMYLKLK